MVKTVERPAERLVERPVAVVVAAAAARDAAAVSHAARPRSSLARFQSRSWPKPNSSTMLSTERQVSMSSKQKHARDLEESMKIKKK